MLCNVAVVVVVVVVVVAVVVVEAAGRWLKQGVDFPCRALRNTLA